MTMAFTTPIPLSLYIHLPWCVRKCPYCDFNSHHQPDKLPEADYIQQLIADLDCDLPRVWGRRLQSIFIGGGTPSLFSGQAIGDLLNAIDARFALKPNTEITLEANPGTVEQQKFQDFFAAGVNRISLGIQSFDDVMLKKLGRIHGRTEALAAISAARQAGFENVNLDVMHGLPGQSLEDGLKDLNTALHCQPEHVSWYQLTLEPNTLFYKHPPALPHDDVIDELQTQGQARLAACGFERYEISAYTRAEKHCQHNLNYWQFGDYLGIGAGAHSKITDVNSNTITRLMKHKHPKRYLQSHSTTPSPTSNMTADAAFDQRFVQTIQQLSEADRIFEYMLNHLRLFQPIEAQHFCAQTGLSFDCLQPALIEAEARGWLLHSAQHVQLTELGHRFANDVISLFLKESQA